VAKIQVLDKAIAELIAAGEVVERPASIVKELIENSVDAGATAITVEVEGGGISLLRVSDNGCGIARNEVSTAFLRHATSKISSQDDLEAIATLGFRGEALASIAAMAKVDLLTKTAGETEGTLYRIEGGNEIELSPAGCPQGSVITVRDLFYNTPARMKFLKKDVGEANAVAQVVSKLALAYPQVAFRFLREGGVKLQTSGSGDLLSAISAVYGSEFAAAMRAVEHAIPEEGVRVTGYVTSTQGAKPSRVYQNFFLNSRYIRTRTAGVALEEAFKTYISGGKYPGCVLHIELVPSLVDVNVHPAKIEVRFVNEKPIYHAVYFAAKGVVAPLDQGKGWRGGDSQSAAARTSFKSAPAQPQPEGRMSIEQFKALYTPRKQKNLLNQPLSFHDASHQTSPEKIGDRLEFTTIPEQNRSKITHNLQFAQPDAVSEPIIATLIKEDVAGENEKPELIGELSGLYILASLGNDLVIIDKHAAHERILYDRLKRDLAYGNRQILLSPLTVTLAGQEHQALIENPKRLEELGFLLEDFGGNAVLVREIPIEMGEREVASLLGEIAAKLSKGKRDLTPEVLDRLYFNIACKGALRAGDKNAFPELEAIIQMLWENPAITHCPHGRPVRATLTAREIEKMFGRQ